MKRAHRRHDISDHIWSLLEPHLPGQEGFWGGRAKDNRLFINAVFWILRTGAPWRDLPPDYGDWKNTHRRFCRWRDKGIWKGLLEQIVSDPDYEWLLIDATHIKVHPHGAGAVGGNQKMGRTKGGSTRSYIWPWMRMVCQSECLLQQVPQRTVRKLTSLLRV
jgi:transposase